VSEKWGTCHDLSEERKITLEEDKIYCDPTISTKTNTISVSNEVLGADLKVKKRVLIKSGDLVIGKMHTQNGSFAIADKEYVSTGTFVPLQIDETRINPKYLFISLRPALNKLGIDDTTGRETYKTEEILAIQIPLPPLEVQNEIVEKIEKQKQIIRGAEKIEENSQTLLELDQFNTNILSSVVLLTRGHNPSSDVFIDEPREGYTRFIQIRDFKNDKFLTFVPTTKQLKLVHKGEIMMAAYRHIGKVSRNVEGAFNVALIKFESKDEQILLNDFLYYLIPSKYIQSELLKVSERAHIPSTSVEIIKDLSIPIPPLETQRQIVEKLDRQMQALEGVRLLKSEAEKRIEEILAGVWGEKI